MSRLIDADALYTSYCNLYEGNVPEAEIDRVAHAIASAPTINPDDLRPRGRWVERFGIKGQVCCSECGTLEKATDSNYKSRSCPNCGARMEGGDG